MTAVLQPTDLFRRERLMSMDDSHSNSSADWREKYNEVADMLAETRAELDDFHHASKELEAELEAELSRTEKAQQDLKIKVEKAEMERDEWKHKFMSLQTNHNTTTASLQRELDRLRQEHQRIKVQLRELEMGNDDLERTERAVSSSLADAEAKYSRALEEKILLEHELLDKANLEEQCQRFKDELRDANVEISILKDQVTAAQASPSNQTFTTHSSSQSTPTVSNDDLFNTTISGDEDLRLGDLGSSSDSLTEAPTGDEDETPRKPSRSTAHSAILQRSGIRPPLSSPHTPPNGIPRSSTLPSSYSPSTRPTPSRSTIARAPSTASTTTTVSTASRSKGVQMVSEMRARVKTLEQKIHTRVPRLRMGSMTTRNGNGLGASTLGSNNSPITPTFTKSVMSRSSWENPLSRKSSESKRSVDSDKDKKEPKTEGWVLIMEDSPSPQRDDKARRRLSSPSRSTPYTRSTPPISSSPTFRSSKFTSTSSGGLKRPQSRLSATSTSTTLSSASVSRPSTPTFLPLPSAGMYSGVSSGKRSTGPGASTTLAQPKRSSLGASTAAMPPPSEVPRRPTSAFVGRSKSPTTEGGKPLPNLPSGLPMNVTMRSGTRLPTSSSTLSQSRIGRPSGGGATRRKSVDIAESDTTLRVSDLRPRSGSSAGFK